MYLDSAIIVKLFVREIDSFFFAEYIEGHNDAVTSELAVTECWTALFRKEREGAISVDIRKTAWQKMDRSFKQGRIDPLPISSVVLHRARLIIERTHPYVPLRSLDAIHLATCEDADAFPLLSNDKRMRDAAALLRFPLGPLPTEQG